MAERTTRTAANKPSDVFTASQVAGFCEVDLKTIHNWAEKGTLAHFRTPGRHLRFRRDDVLDFLRRYGYAIPRELCGQRLRIHVIDGEETWLSNIRRAFGKQMDVSTHQDPVDGLLGVASAPPDALVVEARLADLDLLRCVSRIRRHASTRNVRCVVFSSQPDTRRRALDAGAAAFVEKPDVERLRDTVEALLGLTRRSTDLPP